MTERAATTPLALDALSTHDTKRSADARAVLIALSHFPALARDLYGEARARASAAGLPEGWGLYALQTALILRGEPDAEARIADHIAKAMREAKDLSHHEAPDETAEDAVIALCRVLHYAVSDGSLLAPEDAARLDAAVEAVVLAQVALHLTAPGVPDIYQGTESLAIALTDPDNRRAVDWGALESAEASGLAARKLALTRTLLAHRRLSPTLFARGNYNLWRQDDGWTIEREWQGERFAWTIAHAAFARSADGGDGGAGGTVTRPANAAS
jgi:(1->4)-alpha-D-glucan 1-alpha-D-glucosylmutase